MWRFDQKPFPYAVYVKDMRRYPFVDIIRVFLPPGGIGMLASTSLLIIYIAVNTSHLCLLKETGAKCWIVLTSLLSNHVFFGVLIYYEFVGSKLTLKLLVITVFFCFSVKWIYSKFSGRSIKEKTN